ncbi:hypothetical protein FOA52_014201 [Chlamydomonas sp. UWO 241]|nr:hypothetical protein FOA52_014201 [Chlamydomonas sp. UWO 241]
MMLSRASTSRLAGRGLHQCHPLGTSPLLCRVARQQQQQRRTTGLVARASEQPPQGGPPEEPQPSSSEGSSPQEAGAPPPSTSGQPQQPRTTSNESQLLSGVPELDLSTVANLQISKEVIEELKFKVFSFDTFWVTSVDNYEADGVVFKGNMRGKDSQAAYNKIQERMVALPAIGDAYQLFLLEDMEGKPTAVILPKARASEGGISRVTEIWLAVLFAILTAVTTANANGVPLLQFLIDPFRTPISNDEVTGAIVPALAFFFILGSHEWGHWWAAKKRGVELYLPLIVPAGFGFLGSFGGITRFKGFCPSRSALLEISATGPLVGAATSGALVFIGFVLTALGATDVTIDSPSFADSFLMAVAAQAFLGDALLQPEVQVNSLMVAGWAGLIVNSLNCIPAGELDGGRIALAIWGRKNYNLLSIASTGVLAVTALASSLSFYWIAVVLFLQRGPLLPCAEELGEPTDETSVTTGLAMLFLPLLVLAPYPIELFLAMEEVGSATF